MDRRELLFGMTALGIASRFDLNDLLSAQTLNASSTTGKTVVSDRERDGLRGPVKECIYAGERTQYDMEGRSLSWRTTRGSGTEYSKSWTYDGAGRLQKLTLGNSNGSSSEHVYSYDESGRLQSITQSTGSQTAFQYDEQGLKTSVRAVAPQPDRGNVAIAEGAIFDYAEDGFRLTEGGIIATHYNERDQPWEVEVRDTEGFVLYRIARSYDKAGRLAAEQLINEDPGARFAKQMLAKLPEGYRTDEGLKQIREQLRDTWKVFANAVKSYEYDTRNRLIKASIRKGIGMLEETTNTYNDQGDIIEENRTYSETADSLPAGVAFHRDENGNLIPDKPESEWPEQFPLPGPSTTRYAYQYDTLGNWTEKKTFFPGAGEPVVEHRTLTYY